MSKSEPADISRTEQYVHPLGRLTPGRLKLNLFWLTLLLLLALPYGILISAIGLDPVEQFHFWPGNFMVLNMYFFFLPLILFQAVIHYYTLSKRFDDKRGNITSVILMPAVFVIVLYAIFLVLLFLILSSCDASNPCFLQD
ncbi:MAG: hypothetical protein ACYC4M_00595 [Thermoleophilia bacterium]